MRKDKIDMDILFSNFKQIYELAKKFLELLYKHVKNVDFNKQNVGEFYFYFSHYFNSCYIRSQIIIFATFLGISNSISSSH